MSKAPREAGSQEATTSSLGADQHDEFLNRIGHMTRSLHDNLRGLGFDRLLEKAASDMPDARDRLEYVAMMTEKAAQRVLNATEVAGPLQDKIVDGAGSLSDQWKDVTEKTSLKQTTGPWQLKRKPILIRPVKTLV